jgi:energy-coupling factor transporter transmembrane protein EcfT
MVISWNEWWGCAHGVVRRLTPQTRILCGFLLLAGSLGVPTDRGGGLALLAIGLGIWLWGCGLPISSLGKLVGIGMALHLPSFLLVPFISAPETEGAFFPATEFRVPWNLFIRGMSGMLFSISTTATLALWEFREGVIRLPVPRPVAVILIQICQHIDALVRESSQMAAAIAVRGALAGGFSLRRLLCAIPQVWLPRVLRRADRVANVMDFREYGDMPLGSLMAFPLSWRDYAALSGGVLFVGLAFLLRWESCP